MNVQFSNWGMQCTQRFVLDGESMAPGSISDMYVDSQMMILAPLCSKHEVAPFAFHCAYSDEYDFTVRSPPFPSEDQLSVSGQLKALRWIRPGRRRFRSHPVRIGLSLAEEL